MPTPNASLATLRPEFGVSLELFDLLMSQKGFVATKVMPVTEVGVAAGTYGKLLVEQILSANNNLQRKAGAAYPRDNNEFTTDTFVTQEYGFEQVVDDNDAATYGNYFSAEQLAASRARDKVMRGYEIRVANTLMNTNTFTGASLTASASTSWSTVASATPTTDVMAAKKALYANLGIRANAVIVTYLEFLNLQQNADLISRIKYSGLQDPNTRDITAQAIANAFDVEQLIVADAQYNSANEGQTAVLSTVWPAGLAMVAHVAQTNDVREPCVGRTFHWGGSGSVIGGAMEAYRDEPIRSNVMRCRHQTQEKIITSLAGFLITGCGTT